MVVEMPKTKTVVRNSDRQTISMFQSNAKKSLLFRLQICLKNISMLEINLYQAHLVELKSKEHMIRLLLL